MRRLKGFIFAARFIIEALIDGRPPIACHDDDPPDEEPEWMKIAAMISERTGFSVRKMELRGSVWFCQFRAPDTEGDGLEWISAPLLLDGRWRTERVSRMIRPGRRRFRANIKLQ